MGMVLWRNISTKLLSRISDWRLAFSNIKGISRSGWHPLFKFELFLVIYGVAGQVDSRQVVRPELIRLESQRPDVVFVIGPDYAKHPASDRAGGPCLRRDRPRDR